MGRKLRWASRKTNIWNWVHADKVSQAFWHEWRKGNTISTPRGDVAYLDLRHLGEKKLHERLPFICELAKPTLAWIRLKTDPGRSTAHYTMGGIETNQNCETRIKGLFAVGEVLCWSARCKPSRLRLPGGTGGLRRLAGEQATERAATAGNGNKAAIEAQAAGVEQRLKDLVNQDGSENWAKMRDEMGVAMEEGCGITVHRN
ncbi:FAD-binding protein [Shigella flexneri]